jgi:hypothetical protein
MLNEEQQDDLLRLVKAATEQLGTAKEKLAQAEQKLQANTELLNKSTQSIQVLLRFIEANGLQPPLNFGA